MMRASARNTRSLIILIAAALLMAATACVQGAPKGTKTGFFWEDSKGQPHDIYITDKGSCYILVVSEKTGKQYESYLPKEIAIAIREQMQDPNMELDVSNNIAKDSIDFQYTQ